MLSHRTWGGAKRLRTAEHITTTTTKELSKITAKVLSQAPGRSVLVAVMLKPLEVLNT